MKCNNIIPTIIAAAIFSTLLIIPAFAGDKAEPPEKPAAAKAETKPPKNVAEVNGQGISFADYTLQLELFQRRLQAQGQSIPPQYLSAIRSQVLNDLINSELLWQESRKQGLELKTEQVDKELGAIKARYPDQKQFAAILANMNLTETGLKEQIAQRGAVRALIDKEIASKIKVGDEEAKTFYDENPDYFKRPEQVHASHILIKVAKDATPEEKAQARKKLTGIKKRLKAGEDFAALAKENSEGPSNVNGGDLGFFGKGKMVKPFEDSVFALKNDEVSEIVETDFGYHLIKLLERRPAETVAYEEAKPKIISNLRNERIQQKVKEYLDTLRKDAKIKTYLE